LAAVAIVIAIVAVGINFVIPGPMGSKGSTGSQGLQGTTGAGGPPGAEGQPYNTFFAVVNSNATLARGTDVNTTYIDGGAGEYGVVFDVNVTNCSYVATLGLTGSEFQAPPGFVTVTGLAGLPDGVYVATFNVTGNQTNESFHLTVLCSAGLWAVVNSDGTLARGSDVNYTENDSGAGQYGVVFNQTVVSCVYVATLGLTGSTGQAPPGFITVTGLNAVPDGVYVATFNATGVQTSESFHLGVFC